MTARTARVALLAAPILAASLAQSTAPADVASYVTRRTGRNHGTGARACDAARVPAITPVRRRRRDDEGARPRRRHPPDPAPRRALDRAGDRDG